VLRIYLGVIVLCLAACKSGSGTTEPPSEREAVVGPAHNSSGPAIVTEDKMATRLHEVAQQYPDAIIERLALSDLAFPLDAVEAEALRGYTVLLLTATSQIPTELPIARAYTSCAGQEEELARVAWHVSLIEQDWAQVVGPFRYDGIYLIPVERVGRPECALMIDYAENRVGQVVTVFDAGIPADVHVLPAGELPDEGPVRAILAREYPVVVQ
jgi:hypothetical protein